MGERRGEFICVNKSSSLLSSASPIPGRLAPEAFIGGAVTSAFLEKKASKETRGLLESPSDGTSSTIWMPSHDQSTDTKEATLRFTECKGFCVIRGIECEPQTLLRMQPWSAYSSQSVCDIAQRRSTGIYLQNEHLYRSLTDTSRSTRHRTSLLKFKSWCCGVFRARRARGSWS